jgi:hypothetical protein
MCMSSLSLPPRLVRPASRPFSGKNFGAVCSGVVGVPLDELLPPPVPLASLVLGCARTIAGRVGDGVTVVMVLADVPVGSPAGEGAEVVCN